MKNIGYTIGRSASEGNTSGSFYPPLVVAVVKDGSIQITSQDNSASTFDMWPSEAVQVAHALLAAAVRVNPNVIDHYGKVSSDYRQ